MGVVVRSVVKRRGTCQSIKVGQDARSLLLLSALSTSDTSLRHDALQGAVITSCCPSRRRSTTTITETHHLHHRHHLTTHSSAPAIGIQSYYWTHLTSLDSHQILPSERRWYALTHLHSNNIYILQQLANSYLRVKTSLASEEPVALQVRPATTTRRETRRTSRSTSLRHSPPLASAARRESRPALPQLQSYPQYIQPHDAN